MGAQTSSDDNARREWTFKVKPRSQQKMLLGDFTDVDYEGFEVVVTPDSVPDDAVISQVILLEEKGRKRLYMHVENFDDRAVEAHVRQL